MSNPPPVWEGVLRLLHTELPDFVLETWIRPLGICERPDRLVLEAPSEFHRRRVESRFLPAIRRAATQAAGRELEVAVVRADQADTSDARPADAPAAKAATAAPASGLGPRPDAGPPPPAPVERPPSRPIAPATGRAAAAPTTRQPELPYSFETFVVGPANALAREASLAVAQGRQPGMSPLVLVGPSGTGKSHLARALAVEARTRGLRRTVYASAESFTAGLTSSIRSRETSGFKRRYREECDLLVLEDVQFLTGKTATQLELFHTIEHLRLVGRNVVLTGDRLPRDIPGLHPRLASEMSSGLVALIEPPDADLRRQILRVKASRGGVRLPEECLDRLVDSVRGSVRDLEGVLRQLVASAALLNRPIDLALTDEALHKVVAPGPGLQALDVASVIDCVASFFSLSPRELASRSRRQGILLPRQLAMYLCHRYTDATLAEIGRALGRDHPAVRNGIDKVEREILERAPLRYHVEALAARIEGRGARRNRGAGRPGS